MLSWPPEVMRYCRQLHNCMLESISGQTCGIRYARECLPFSQESSYCGDSVVIELRLLFYTAKSICKRVSNIPQTSLMFNFCLLATCCSVPSSMKLCCLLSPFVLQKYLIKLRECLNYFCWYLWMNESKACMLPALLQISTHLSLLLRPTCKGMQGSASLILVLVVCNWQDWLLNSLLRMHTQGDDNE